MECRATKRYRWHQNRLIPSGLTTFACGDLSMIRLTTPIPEAQARALKVGDEVLLNGKLVLSRDMGHKYMKEQKPEWLKPILKDMVIYHCGPVVKKHEDGSWSFV